MTPLSSRLSPLPLPHSAMQSAQNHNTLSLPIFPESPTASSRHLPSSSTLHCSRSKSQRKLKRTKYHQQQLNHHASKANRIFPKSTPTLLLPSKRSSTITTTKFQVLEAVIHDLETSIENGFQVFDAQIFTSLLEACFRLRAIDHGIRVHGLIPRSLLRNNAGICSKLLRLYSSSGQVEKAHQVFDEMPKRDGSAFPWNSLMSGYAEVGLYEDAIALYFQMEEDGIEPDVYTFPRVLKACAGIGSIQIGEAVHRSIVRHGFSSDVFALNSLVDMYGKCGDIVKAQTVFDGIACRDSISWNSMLAAYIRHGLWMEAVDTFCQMIVDGFEPDSSAISTILTGVSSPAVISQIHGWVLRRGSEWSLSVANALISSYSSLGKLDRACWLFNEMPERDIISWNSIISAHSKNPRALAYFARMESACVVPDAITFVSILSACARSGLVEDGERIFYKMKEKYGISPSMEHYSCLVNLYGRAGLINEAYNTIKEGMEFEAGPTIWGALLYGCYLHGNVDIGEIAAERLFDLEPDNEHNFDVLMQIYTKESRTEDVERIRKMKRDRGLEDGQDNRLFVQNPISPSAWS